MNEIKLEMYRRYSHRHINVASAFYALISDTTKKLDVPKEISHNYTVETEIPTYIVSAIIALSQYGRGKTNYAIDEKNMKRIEVGSYNGKTKSYGDTRVLHGNCAIKRVLETDTILNQRLREDIESVYSMYQPYEEKVYNDLILRSSLKKDSTDKPLSVLDIYSILYVRPVSYIEITSLEESLLTLSNLKGIPVDYYNNPKSRTIEIRFDACFLMETIGQIVDKDAYTYMHERQYHTKRRVL